MPVAVVELSYGLPWQPFYFPVPVQYLSMSVLGGAEKIETLAAKTKQHPVGLNVKWL